LAKHSFRGTITSAVLVVAIVIGGYLGWRHFSAGHTSAVGAAATPSPVPVTVADVQKADFPVYLFGLGTVQPYDTVTVRSRVDGEVLKVGFRQGQMVQEGDVLVQIDPRPYQAALDQAAAKKAQDEASLKDAQLNLARYSSLASRDFASQQQFNTQQSTVQQLMAQIQGDQASIDNAQTQLSYTTIKSPLTGRTGFRLVDPGNIVNAAQTTGIVTIVKLQPISVVFTAPEEDVGDISKALADGTVPVTAMSTDGTKILSEGRLGQINNEVDQASGTISMKARFENQDNRLWPGLSVSTRLLLDTLRQVVVVPDGAIERGPNGLYVYLVGSGAKVQTRDVAVSHDGNGQSVITKGLNPGDEVVISGQYRLQAGTLVAANKIPPDAGTAVAAAPNASPGAR